MGVLYAKVGGAWVPLTVGGGGPPGPTGPAGAPGTPGTPGADEVFIGPADPGFTYEMWYDTDATPPGLTDNGYAIVDGGTATYAGYSVFDGGAA